MSATRTVSVTLTLAALLAAVLAENAGAIPAFARRYKMSCTTCHAPFPRLKAYGDEFAGAGFVIPEQETDGLISIGRYRFPDAGLFPAQATFKRAP